METPFARTDEAGPGATSPLPGGRHTDISSAGCTITPGALVRRPLAASGTPISAKFYKLLTTDLPA
jgi:hypothetical protein